MRRAAKAKRRSEQEYRAALAAALAAGRSYAEIARAVGVSRQAVRQALTRDFAGVRIEADPTIEPGVVELRDASGRVVALTRHL